MSLSQREDRCCKAQVPAAGLCCTHGRGPSAFSERSGGRGDSALMPPILQQRQVVPHWGCFVLCLSLYRTSPSFSDMGLNWLSSGFHVQREGHRAGAQGSFQRPCDWGSQFSPRTCWVPPPSAGAQRIRSEQATGALMAAPSQVLIWPSAQQTEMEENRC